MLLFHEKNHIDRVLKIRRFYVSLCVPFSCITFLQNSFVVEDILHPLGSIIRAFINVEFHTLYLVHENILYICIPKLEQKRKQHV